MNNREFIIAQPRKRVLRHKWKPYSQSRNCTDVCEKCGCVREFDFDSQRYIYSTIKGITHIRPECKL